ncbi:hypothetical protein [Lyngbya aestuarii]|uniref:hypothetical protein n=1 Tax=Lyngbya aestuarii TaxID=118322 RepID=UPI00403D99BD
MLTSWVILSASLQGTSIPANSLLLPRDWLFFLGIVMEAETPVIFWDEISEHSAT